MIVIEQNLLLAAFLIWSLLLTLSVFALSGFLLRRYMTLHKSDAEEYEKRIEEKRRHLHDEQRQNAEKTEAIRQMIWRMNHRGIRPKVASLKGCSQELILRRMPAMFDALELASRPNHYPYVKLAILETQDFEECVKVIVKLSNELDALSVETWKEFEHLQE